MICIVVLDQCFSLGFWVVVYNGILCVNYVFAGLSLLEYPNLKAIDPAYALPVDVVNRIFFCRKMHQ